MADDSSSAATGDPNSRKPESTTPIRNLNPNLSAIPNPSPTQPPQQHSQSQVAAPDSNPTPVFQPGPPYAPSQIPGALISGLPPPPPFRPGLQFTHVANFQNPSGQSPGVPPPGVSSGGVLAAPGSMPSIAAYQAPPGQLPNSAGMRPFPPMSNGYPGIHGVGPPGVMPPPGLLRYPSPYPVMVRPGFPMRPPGTMGAVQLGPRPPVPGIPGMRPMMPPIVRPATVPFVIPERPQTTIYIGKIATVENNFMLSILQFCGPLKHWKRAEDPTTGKPKGFGFYEFESAEGILRAIRLLTKLNIDGQELLVNVNQATKEYLQKYVEKKTENARKTKESQTVGTEENQPEGSENEREKIETGEKCESGGPTSEETGKEGEPKSRENIDIANSAVVTDEEREADREAKEKISSAIEERLRTNPLPPPPPPPPPAADGSGMELAFKSKDGDFNPDIARSDSAANDVETSGEHNKADTSSPDWSRKNDRRSRDRDRERDFSREKEQEMDRHDREAERERARKEREQRRKLEDAERAYQARLRQWERREREKEKERQYEKEREKDKERKRKKEIRYEEVRHEEDEGKRKKDSRYEEDEDEDDDDSRRRWNRNALDERRRRRLREKEDDLADRLKEEEEVAEAKRKAEEQKLQQQQIEALRLLSGQAIVGSDPIQKSPIDKEALQTVSESVHEHHAVDFEQNGSGSEMSMAIDNNASEAHAPSKKLGFGLVGSGKRTSVHSVFYEEDEDEAHKDKKMKPLVPIDYTTEEQEAVAHGGSGLTPTPLDLAAEFAKQISSTNPQDETRETEKQRSRRSHDKSSHRDRDRDRGRDRGDGHSAPTKDSKEPGKAKVPETKNFQDAKQLIDTIPKKKEELFSYEINWAMYDKHQLHERMRPWISKKIMEFLGEEEATLVDFIVLNTQEHVKASQMLEQLQSILDEEAEMFVMKMWRMLIFEIKRAEAEVPVKSKP